MFQIRAGSPEQPGRAAPYAAIADLALASLHYRRGKVFSLIASHQEPLGSQPSTAFFWQGLNSPQDQQDSLWDGFAICSP